ncbi:DUF6491 family protein [Dokdonella sp. MW10]|uniref:DUF6491 family protein n=1 Tax=Dokdonella sp. MW10 TaxID=2992926 RepID=UPI003F7FCC66
MKVTVLVLAALAGMSLYGVHAQTRDTQKQNLEAYAPFLGQPVEQFQFFNLQKWELVGEDKVIVWPRLNDAFLLTVDKPCRELEWAQSIGITSTANRVSRRFDSVKAGADTCRIQEIRPLDYKAFQVARREDKAS